MCRSQMQISTISSSGTFLCEISSLGQGGGLFHNHPSGDPSPSKQDIAVTRDIAEVGKRLGIQLHDHVIIGARGHASLRALGLI